MVARCYRAKAVLLADWKKGRMPILYTLKRRFPAGTHPHDAWFEVQSIKELFR
jgi:hypothetical protein